MIFRLILGAVLSYLLGILNFGIILSRKFQKEDVRTHGSGNAGSTNMLRNYGKLPAVATILGDMAKVAVAILLVRLLGYDFLNASINAKLMNVTTNIAAIALFALKGHVWWHFAVPLAVANVLGSVLGTWMALRHGAGFVRVIFIVVVGLLILKTGWDAFGA